MILRGQGGDVDARSLMLTPEQFIAFDRAQRVSSVGVTPQGVMAIPAFDAAVRIASTAVAGMDLRVWRGRGQDKTLVTGGWQARLFRGVPNECQSWYTFWEVVEASMTARRNGYAVKIKPADGSEVYEVYALHPDQVRPRWQHTGSQRVEYQVTVQDGYVDPFERGNGHYVVPQEDMLHWRGPGGFGRLQSPTPIEAFRQTMVTNIASITSEARMWERGMLLQLGVEFPSDVSPAQARTWKDLFMDKHAGPGGDTVAVVGGGAHLTPISMTMRDAMFVESRQLGVIDMALMTGVPASLLENAASPGSRVALPLEQETTRWLRFGIQPRLSRLVALLNSDPDFFLPARSYCAFDTEGFVTGDVATEAVILHQYVQDGVLTADEVRAILGYEPHPDGLGAIPQVVPVGGGANPAPAGTPAEQETSAEQAGGGY